MTNCSAELLESWLGQDSVQRALGNLRIDLDDVYKSLHRCCEERSPRPVEKRASTALDVRWCRVVRRGQGGRRQSEVPSQRFEPLAGRRDV